MIIGITGGTGCGKTTLLEQIRMAGGTILDCDAIYHGMLQSDEALLNTLQHRFPDAFESGKLDRKKLGSIVFSDPHALEALNRITHSAIVKEVQHRLSPPPALAAVDAIALIESGLASLCDITVAVTAPEGARVARLIQRDNISEAYARSRISAQKPERWFREHCDYVLENDSSFDSFRKKCIAFLKKQGILAIDEL